MKSTRMTGNNFSAHFINFAPIPAVCFSTRGINSAKLIYQEMIQRSKEKIFLPTTKARSNHFFYGPGNICISRIENGRDQRPDRFTIIALHSRKELLRKDLTVIQLLAGAKGYTTAVQTPKPVGRQL